MNSKKTVVIGLLGPTLDFAGKKESRWKKWRPSVSACWQEDVKVSRYDLIFQKRFTTLKNQIADDIKVVSPNTVVHSHEIEFEDPWDFGEVFSKLHDFSKHYPFKPESEDYLVNITTGTHVAQICLFLLAESRYIPGKLYQLNIGPKERVRGSARIIDLDISKYDPIASRFLQEKQESQELLKAGIRTKNETFNQLISKIERVALHSKDPILLMGKTGCGKTEMARRIFHLKKNKHRFSGKFVEINCATLKGDLVMSTLFGHKKGAFTGALGDRIGLLKEADQGLLFLDEIGELGLDEQAMLLRAIEEKRFLAMGSNQEEQSDFQLIAGTNRDLNEFVSIGRFRDDLLSRINLWTFKIPDLKDRREDLEPNIEFELEKFSRKNGIKMRFTREAREIFLKFAETEALWPGNFRDLNAVITRLGTMASSEAHSGKIHLDLVSEEIESLRTLWNENCERKDFPLLSKMMPAEDMARLDLFEKIQLEGVIKACKGTRSLSEAGRKLFGVSRTLKSASNDSDRLKKYLAKYKLSLHFT